LTFVRRTPTTFIGLATVSTAAALLLTGCAGQSAEIDQSLTVTYADAGETVEVTVDLPQIDCSDLAGTLLYGADGENGDDDWGLLNASGNAELNAHTISIGLGDGLWFISTDTFESDDTSLTLSDHTGLVAPVGFTDRISDVGESIDTAATATGTVECTS
jgi:hypothetical protein